MGRLHIIQLSCSHDSNVSTKRIETLFWTSRLGLVTPKSRSRLSLRIICLTYNPALNSAFIYILLGSSADKLMV